MNLQRVNTTRHMATRHPGTHAVPGARGLGTVTLGGWHSEGATVPLLCRSHGAGRPETRDPTPASLPGRRSALRVLPGVPHPRKGHVTDSLTEQPRPGKQPGSETIYLNQKTKLSGSFQSPGRSPTECDFIVLKRKVS